MNKHIFYALGVAGALTLGTSNFALGEVTAGTKNLVEKVLDNPAGPVKVEEKPVVNDSNRSVQEKQEVSSQLLAKKKISDMKETPLEMKGIKHKNNLSQFLGLNQYKLILENYNKDIVKRDKSGNIIDDKNLYLQNEITFPLVFDGLKSTFPESLDDFIVKNDEFKKDIKESRTVFIITKTLEKKFALAYYKDGKLTLATHISPGLISKAKTKQKYNKETGKMETVIDEEAGINTPSGTFYIKKSKKTFIRYKRSKAFKNAPMPYAIWVTGGTFLHHRANVDGKKRSHGCIGVPGFYEEFLYNEAEDETKMVIKYTNS